MEHHDKLFEQIKNAESSAESREFPGLDSVWSRVEDKLDNKVLVRQNKKWKYWAAAASVVAVMSIGYQFFKTDVYPEAVDKKSVVVATDSIQPTFEADDINAVTNATPDTTILRNDAPQILEHTLNSANVADADHDAASPVPAAAAESVPSEAGLFAPAPKAEEMKENDAVSSGMLSRKGVSANGHVFKARTVRRDFFEVEPSSKSDDLAKAVDKKSAPLMVVDGKPVVAKNEAEYKKKAKAVADELQESQADTIVHLKEPLYIINGVEYSEESLFGPNPTSPYAPLNLQEEGMTTVILTGKEATKRYGAKGLKGVVVITTKNGKPAPKK